MRRAYYHCADCGHGVVPRDDELGVAGSSLSPGLATMVDRAGAAAPFAKASSLLGDLAGIALTTKRVERAAEADGAAAAAATQAHAGAILSRRVVPLPPAPLPDKLYIAVDGTGVPMVPAETAGRAGKAAAGRARPTPARPNSPACSPRPAWTPTADPCATPAPPPTWPPSPPSNSSPRWCTPRPAAADQNTSANSSCSATAHPGSGTWPGNASPPPPRSSTTTTPASTCTTWLRTRPHPRPGPPGLADRPAGRPRRRRHPALTAAARDLPLTNTKAGEVDRALGYFETNAQRMRYARFRELGMFVGSGAVEAGCKAIIGQRLKLSGMRWSERGADAIAALRCHDASGQWAEI